MKSVRATVSSCCVVWSQSAVWSGRANRTGYERNRRTENVSHGYSNNTTGWPRAQQTHTHGRQTSKICKRHSTAPDTTGDQNTRHRTRDTNTRFTIVRAPPSNERMGRTDSPSRSLLRCGTRRSACAHKQYSAAASAASAASAARSICPRRTRAPCGTNARALRALHASARPPRHAAALSDPPPPRLHARASVDACVRLEQRATTRAGALQAGVTRRRWRRKWRWREGWRWREDECVVCERRQRCGVRCLNVKRVAVRDARAFARRQITHREGKIDGVVGF